MSQIPAVQPAAFPAPAYKGPEFFSGTIVEDPSAEPAIRRYWRILYKHRWLVLSIILFCVALSLIVTMLTPRQYTATVMVQIAREVDKIVDMDQVDEQQSGAAGMEFYQTQYALLKSRSLSEAVVRDLNLVNNHLFLSGHNPGEVDEVAALPVDERFELATTMVNESTTVSPIRGSSIIDVGFEARNPSFAAGVANSIANNFIRLNLERRYEAAAYARDFLQRRLAQVRTRLEESERKAIEYAQQQGLIRIQSGDAENPTSQSLIAANLAELSSQLTIARAQRAQAEAQFRSGAAGSVAAQSLTSTTLNELRRQRAELIAQLGKLESDFGPEYPPVAALKAQIAELDRQIGMEQQRVRSSVVTDLGGQYQQALATEQSLQQRVDSLKTQLLGEQNRSIRFNILQRDVDTNRGLYEALLQRFKEVGIAGGVGINNISIVDQALPPGSPSSPNLPLNLALGLLLGIVLGGAAAIMREQLSEAIILPAEFQSKLRVPLLGSTPAMKSESRMKLLPSRATEQQDSKPVLVDDRSELYEAYFSILTAVQFSTTSGAPKTIAVTSSQAGEGKSTTAIALARALVSVGNKVLLIDGDMRNPSLHRVLGMARGKGLADMLTGHATLGDCVQDSDIPQLKVLTAGGSAPNPAELLASDALGRILKTAGETFDHVIVDSPPVLGLADAPLITRSTEGTIFVVEAGRTRSTQARHALDRLFAVQAHVLGAVLTKLDSRSTGYGYGYGYNYRYGTT